MRVQMYVPMAVCVRKQNVCVHMIVSSVLCVLVCMSA